MTSSKERKKPQYFIFTNGRLPLNWKFSLQGLELKVNDNFTYKGITLSKTGNFNLAKTKNKDKNKTKNAEKGIKAMY